MLRTHFLAVEDIAQTSVSQEFPDLQTQFICKCNVLINLKLPSCDQKPEWGDQTAASVLQSYGAHHGHPASFTCILAQPYAMPTGIREH